MATNDEALFDNVFTDAVCGDEIYQTYAELKTPRQPQIDALIALGIQPLTMIRDWRGLWSDIRTAKIEWLSGNRFEFADEGKASLIVQAYDEAGSLIDLVAFNSKGRIGSWLGNASVLGGENLPSPRLSDGLSIFRDPLEWLANSRKGCVIVDAKRARIALECSGPLVAQDERHARELRALLRHEPTVIVRGRRAENEAA